MSKNNNKGSSNSLDTTTAPTTPDNRNISNESLDSDQSLGDSSHENAATNLLPQVDTLTQTRLNELFNAVKLTAPNLQALVLSTAFVIAYGATISAPAFYSLTEYASKAIYDELSDTDIPVGLLASFEGIVKIASVVPTILSANSGRLQLAHILNQSTMHYQRGGLSELAVRLPELIAKESIPVLVSLISSLGSGNVTYSRLEDEYPIDVVQWCAIAAQVSATVTNFRQLSNLLVDPWMAYFRQQYRQFAGDISAPRENLQVLFKNYGARVDAIAKHAHEQLKRKGKTELEAPLAAEEDSSLARHYIHMRSISKNPKGDVGQLLAAMHAFVDGQERVDPMPMAKTWQKWVEGTMGKGKASYAVGRIEEFCDAYDVGPKALNALFLIIACIYTIPQYESAAKAGPFAEQEGIEFLSGEVMGGASFAVNTFINFYSLWTLYSAVTQPKTVDRDWGDFGLLALKALLVTVYTVSQLGIVKAFPFEPSFMSDDSYQAIAWVQLALAGVVAPGLALFSISGAFDQLLAYKLSWQKADRLATLTPEAELSPGLVQAMVNDLKGSAKAFQQRIDSVSSTEVTQIVQTIPNSACQVALSAMNKPAANDERVQPKRSGYLTCCNSV